MASNRITIKGILSGEYSFERPSFGYGYGTETVTIYKISSEDGKVYVWKTTGSLSKQVEVPFETNYSDCETVKGSFFRDEFTGESKIKVIIRNGRMKASGVRGQKFMNYIFSGTENGRTFTFCAWAVSEANARKQMTKEFPNVTDMVLIRTCRRNGKGQMY